MISSIQNLPFLKIQSEDPQLRQKGHLLQLLVLLITGTSIFRVFISIFIEPASTSSPSPSLIQLTTSLIFLVACLILIGKGRVILAAHFYAIVLISVFFMLLITEYGDEIGLPYFMLIPVIVIATFDSIKTSTIYALLVVTAIGIYTAVTPNYTLLDFSFFTLVTIAICITIWVTANDLQKTVSQANKFAAESQQKSELLQKRTRQLEHSARFGQRAGVSLNLEQLLADTAVMVKQEFEFYVVSIFLLDETSQRLYLRQIAGVTEPESLIGTYYLDNNEQSIVGWSATLRQARIANDVSVDSVYFAEEMLPQTKSELALPLIARDEMLGVLDVQSQQLGAFQDEDVAILQIVANQLAVNIDNARLYAKTASSLYEIRILHQFNSQLTTTIDLGEIYRRAARSLTKELNARRCLILSWPEPEALKAEIGYEHGVGFGKQTGFFWETAVFPLADYPQTQQTLHTQRTTTYQFSDPDSYDHKILDTYGASTCLEIPMISRSNAIGVIWLFRIDTQSPFHQSEIELAQAMANQTAVVVANAQLTADAQVRVAQLSTINRMSNLLAHAPTMKEIFEGARREIMALIPATGMSISLITKEKDRVHWVYGHEFGNEVDLSQIPLLPLDQGLTGHVIKTREILYLDKSDQDLRQKLKSFTVGEEQATWLGLPMIVSAELIGVLAVENESSFSEREIELLSTIVGPLASAIYNFIQFEDLQKAFEAQSAQRIHLQTAAEVAAAATSVLDQDELVQESVNLIKERFSLYYVGLFFIDEQSQMANLVAGTGEAGRLQVAAGHSLPIGGQSLIGGATADATPRIIQDVTKNKEWRPNPHLPETKAELALPLRVRGKVIGALTAQSDTGQLFTGELVQVLQTLCDQLATAVDNARLLQRVEARAQRQQALAQISTELHQTADVDEILNISLRAISKHLKGADVQLQMGHTPSHQNETQEIENPIANE